MPRVQQNFSEFLRGGWDCGPEMWKQFWEKSISGTFIGPISFFLAVLVLPAYLVSCCLVGCWSALTIECLPTLLMEHNHELRYESTAHTSKELSSPPIFQSQSVSKASVTPDQSPLFSIYKGIMPSTDPVTSISIWYRLILTQYQPLLSYTDLEHSFITS